MAQKLFTENCEIPLGTHVILVQNNISKEPDNKSFTIQVNFASTIELFRKIKELVEEEVNNTPIFFKEDKKKTHVINIKPKNNEKSMRFMVSYSQASSTDIARIIYKYLCRGQCKF